MKNNLAYYVYIENFNLKKIEKYNVLSDHIIDYIKKETKNITEKPDFAERVKRILMYHFWSKSEWEVIITSWPAHIAVIEVARLQEELQQYKEDYGHEPRVLDVRLRVAEKIDVYDQIMLNWEIFIDYLWNNLRW